MDFAFYNNKYTDISLLGKGSYGSVYLVKDKTDKYFADKRIKLAGRCNYEKQSIINEVRLLSCHNSPFIIELKESYVKDNIMHLITEYASRGDLSKIIKRYKKNNRYFDEDTIKKYLFQICMGIDYLHKNNIMHRDIKSANVFMMKDKSIKIGDVGIIKILSSAVDYTRTHIGTPYYMSPEIYKRQKYNAKTDVWAIGILLYEMMTLKLPYNASNINQLKYKISNEEWYLENKYRMKYSKGLCNILDNMLQSDPLKRYTLKEILQDNYLIDMYNNHTKKSIPFEPSFYQKPVVPYRVSEWKKAIDKYNKPKILNPINKNNEIRSKDLFKPKLDNVKIHKNEKEGYLSNIPYSKDELVNYSIKAENLINDIEDLVKCIVAYKFEDYYNLKQKIKKDINNYKILLNV